LITGSIDYNLNILEKGSLATGDGDGDGDCDCDCDCAGGGALRLASMMSVIYQIAAMITISTRMNTKTIVLYNTLNRHKNLSN